MPIRDLILHLKETRSGHALLDAARDLEQTSRGVDKFGDSSKATTKDLAGLRAEVERTAAAAKDLKLQIARTGDAGLFGDLSKEERNLKRLQKLLQDLQQPAKGAGGGLGDLIGSVPRIGGVSGPAVAGLAGAAVALSPFIGATVAAAVLGGVGTGGVIGGVALAARDARVKAEFKQVGHEIFEGLSDASVPFVDPLVEAASTFRDAWRKELPAVQQDFAVLSKAIDPLAQGLAGFAHNLHPGLSKALRASIPLAEEFGKDMAQFGDDLSNFLGDMADAAPGAKKALHDLFVVLGDGLDMLGGGIKFLSGIYDGLNRIGVTAERVVETGKDLVPFSDEFEQLVEVYRKLNPEIQISVRNLKDTEGAAIDAAKATERNTEALRDFLDTIDNQQDATERYHKGLLDLRDAVKENGTSLSLYTREGLANRDALQEVARATREMHEAGLLTDQAYQMQIQSLEELAVKLDMNRQEVLLLIGAMEKTPRQIVTEAVLKISGASAALLNMINGGGSYNPNAGQQGRGGTDFSTTPVSGTLSKQAFLDMPTRDSGGPVMPGQSYLIGGRPEILTMGSRSGYVTPVGSSAGAQITLRAALSGNALIDALIGMISAEVQHRGGTPETLGITR